MLIHNSEHLDRLKERYDPLPHGNVSEKHVYDVVECIYSCFKLVEMSTT